MTSSTFIVLGDEQNYFREVLENSGFEIIQIEKVRQNFFNKIEIISTLINISSHSIARKILSVFLFAMNHTKVFLRILNYQVAISVTNHNWELGIPGQIKYVYPNKTFWVKRDSSRFGLVPDDISVNLEYDILRRPEHFAGFILPVCGDFQFKSFIRVFEEDKFESFHENSFNDIRDAEIFHGRFIFSQSRMLIPRLKDLNSTDLDFLVSTNGGSVLDLVVDGTQLVKIPTGLYCGSSTNYWHFVIDVCTKFVTDSRFTSGQTPLILQAPIPQQLVWLATLLTGRSPIILQPFEHISVGDLSLYLESETRKSFSISDVRKELALIRKKVLETEIFDAAPPETRIFVPRSQFKFRNLLNRRDIEQYLNRQGFVTVFPETLDMAKQANIFNQAKIIIVESGAAMTNLLYCSEGCIVVEIQPFIAEALFWRTFTVDMPIDHRVLRGNRKYFSRNGISRDSYTVDIEELQQLVVSLLNKI